MNFGRVVFEIREREIGTDRQQFHRNSLHSSRDEVWEVKLTVPVVKINHERKLHVKSFSCVKAEPNGAPQLSYSSHTLFSEMWKSM